MKKIAFFLLPALLIWACSNVHRESTETPPAENVDSLIVEADTLPLPEDEWPDEPIEEVTLPKTVDELFDDFAFEFDHNGRFQTERVRFPLPVVSQEGDTTLLVRKDWQQENLFLRQDFYTVIFNSYRQMDLEKSTDREQVTVEKIHLEEEYTRSYDFSRTEGSWQLTGIRTENFTDTPLHDFLRFYSHFAADSVYQTNHIANPLRYTTEDPDDDMQTLEGTLDAGQWPDFRPDLPKNIITNVRYGQTYRDRHKMVFLKRGISNGLQDVLIFEKAGGLWRLAAYEN